MGIAGAALLAAVVLFVAPLFAYNRQQTINVPLSVLLPAQLDGWAVTTLDIADSAEMKERVIRTLSFDDVIFRAYRRGNSEVQVYVAYWKPGTVPYGQAGVHTPDTCWVNSGWTQEDRAHAQAFSCGPYRAKPAEVGRFSQKGMVLHVMFWHMVGDTPHFYEQHGWRDGLAGFTERFPNLFRDMKKYGLNLAQEQKFVRISSNVPFDHLRTDPAFQDLMAHLAPLGVFQPAS